MILTAIGTFGWWYLGPVGGTTRTVFTVTQPASEFDVPHALFAVHLIRNERVFRWLYGTLVAGSTTAAGGYRLNGSMNAYEIIQKLSAQPDLLWVTLRPGLRKEQVGALLASRLGWGTSETHTWGEVYADNDTYKEGVYFPDTYLLPRDGTPIQIARQIVNHFMQKIVPYKPLFIAKNVSWSEGLTIASIIQREAAGPTDMPLVSGIIWNRLAKGMPLQMDATIQYIVGNADTGWWPVIKPSATSIDSPYNTYLHKGLPPTPIASPGITAIIAAANPAQTDCLYYLHDENKHIHCSVTYEEHLANIKEFLQ